MQEYAKKGATEVAMWGKAEAVGADGFVFVPINKDSKELPMEYAGAPPKVTCQVCGTSGMTWCDWVKHKKAKKHRSKFDKNAYSVDVVADLNSANKMVELAALHDDKTFASGLVIEVVVPDQGLMGRWDGPPPVVEKKEKKTDKKEKKSKKKGGGGGAKPEASSEAEDSPGEKDAKPEELTEDQKEWLKKASLRRQELKEESKLYNDSVIPAVVLGGPETRSPFGAGRGKRL